MAVKIKTVTHYFVTETSWELPADLGDIDDILKATKSTAEFISMYNNGGVLGISTKQRTKMSADMAKKVVDMLGLRSAEF